MSNAISIGTGFEAVTGEALQAKVTNPVNATKYTLLLDYDKGNGTSALINIITLIDSGTDEYYLSQISSSQVISKWQRVFDTTGLYVVEIDLPPRCTQFIVEAVFTGGTTQTLEISGVNNNPYYNR